MKKELWYMNSETGEITQNHHEACRWFYEDRATIWLYLRTENGWNKLPTYWAW